MSWIDKLGPCVQRLDKIGEADRCSRSVEKGTIVSLKVIGAGVGRTGTRSLKLALEHLGLGPCHHMEEVLADQPTQVPLWAAAATGYPDWTKIFEGYESAVDWPTAGFVRELSAAYPSAKVVLTHRSPESWEQSYSGTINQFLTGAAPVPPPMQPWLDMSLAVIAKTGFTPSLDAAGLRKAFIAHNEAIKAAIPSDRLLVYEIKDGWEPLCAFLGRPVPAALFPRTNDRREFWDLVSGKT